MLVQNGFFLTKKYSKNIRNFSSETFVMISNVHGKGVPQIARTYRFQQQQTKIQQKLRSYDESNKAQLFK